MKKEAVVADGKPGEAVVDEAYLATAIREPRTHQVKGYPPNMPIVSLTDEEVSQVVAYIKALK